MPSILTTSATGVKQTGRPYNSAIDGELEKICFVAKFIPSPFDNPYAFDKILARRALELGATHLFDVNWISVEQKDNYSSNGKVISCFAYRPRPKIIQ